MATLLFLERHEAYAEHATRRLNLFRVYSMNNPTQALPRLPSVSDAHRSTWLQFQQ